MSDKQQGQSGPETLFSEWMKTTGNMWTDALQAWSDIGTRFQQQGFFDKNTGGSARTSLDTAAKAFKAASAAMSEPTVMESLFKGVGAMPEILVRLSQTGLMGFLQAQHKWFEQAGRIGKSAEAYRFDDLDENAFRAWADIYENELRQFFQIPQLGLTRFYQEKMNRALDKHNQFQTALGEFFRILHLPMSRSLGVLQEKMGEMAEAGELPEDPKAYYNMWIKILEGHYMTLFQSQEYIETLGRTLETMSEFSSARDEVVEDMLSSLPIPKQTDMDELYREIYLLKKRIKILEKKG
jgi:hypothetical protein